MTTAIKTLMFAFSLLKHSGGPPLTRIASVARLLPIFYFHSTKMRCEVEKSYEQFRRKSAKKEEKNAEWYRRTINKYLSLRSKVVVEGERVRADVERGQTMNSIVKRAFETLGLFYESVQGLVEGRREVLGDPDFRFEDGMTVQEKQ